MEAPIKNAEQSEVEDESGSEDEEDGNDVEETIYEMSDDSAVESEEGSDGEEVSEDEDEQEDEAEATEGVVPLEDGGDEDESEIDEEALLAGIRGSSDSEISESEDEQEDSFGKGTDVIDLDTKEGKKLRSRLEKAAKNTEKPGVVFVGRIPHGFYEDEMRGYFSQFGEIKRLRLSRNPTTGKSRHYAFIEFKSSEVATIAAGTMNNYLMFERLLKCKVVPESDVHSKMFANCKKPSYTLGLNKKQHIQASNRQRTQKELGDQVNRLVKAEKKRRSKLAAAGIDYDFPGYQVLRPPKAKHVKYN
ncbi:nucleolar protein [Coemansia sp. RSA 1813]|nr:nucleolar protein [Coemansia sp. RSA 1646]KAJ1768003.1 nucleolar protein [Coemansia sp. RSA 1843]KAJ2086966.1 nucleolar protein [Coemansia sp. RSA 986]KAJ2211778.1 nucleolar protein [Coemansia sp. RSA 487]KAJ2564357.1 nucleolar protein [Coemansia sp. RSA 1813]